MKGLYIHIPFCLKKCAYCDFISFPNSEQYHSDYVNALIKEMKKYKSEKIDSIFIGGGTPTILTAYQTEKLLNEINCNFDISSGCEFSIEANPKTLDRDKLAIMQKNGVNRLSIGVQSFNDDELKMLGRVHSADDARKTVIMAQDMGFNNINIDLMSALPYQTAEKMLYSLKSAVSLNVNHMSCYSLILEDGTLLEKKYSQGKITVPDEDTDREIYRMICNYLSENGYNQYEISNFAKTNCECRHNIKYWQCREYIGLGVAAHSYIGNSRFYNTNDLKSYISGDYKDGEVLLDKNDMIEEFMIMGLRMNDGVSKSEFQKRFQKTIDEVYKDIIFKHIKNGFIICNGDKYCLSEKGIDVSNSILCDFII